ncbi:tRNA pseudouridine(55) synthase TruB [Sulfuriferula nivalis]|uniref:tRNA pseudouridine synthase B n=1 Tax=Sulfuriferula nivalis TaxID=2675298 RepID=A0A809RIW4_9PROT|nr:tRNA pseudouridine(55) synthase TruB [Sulfuriferula nivalis]BBP01859.1 tRNA pseudouridine synthase B [Sulfuriferula nivalis]
MNAPVKRIKRRIDGVLLLNKPVGITSNTALQIAKRLYTAEKAGHTGTLDPFADGLLPLCFGEATKFSQYQLEADKCYRALLQLGVTTTTGDPEGEVLQSLPVNVSAEQIQATVASFIGDRMQTPPMYSALKHQGKPLYEYARAGITIERPARPVSIKAIEINSLDLDEATVDITVTVSAGTYIRTLAEDIGNQLGCGAHLTKLTRLASGGFQLAQAVTLAQLELDDAPSRDARLAAADGLVNYIPAIQIDAPSAKLLMQGQHPLISVEIEQNGLLRAYHLQQFLGLVQLQADGRLIPQRLMSSHTLLETL